MIDPNQDLVRDISQGAGRVRGVPDAVRHLAVRGDGIELRLRGGVDRLRRRRSQRGVDVRVRRAFDAED
jgi:hypothetical protein